ncbi:hypothetical protein BKH43_05975 [Helicobacter sp. 13S00401-1]|nr:hypothetical protein BKH43_05975 [Helicobacter sp. 13S00401-1]
MLHTFLNCVLFGEALLEPVSWCKKMETSKQKCERHFFARNGISEALPLIAEKVPFSGLRGAGRG